MSTPYDHLVESASTLELDDLKELIDALRTMENHRKPKTIRFEVRQHATLTIETKALVPGPVVAQGSEAVRTWLWANTEKWSEEDGVSTEYGDYVDASLKLN